MAKPTKCNKGSEETCNLEEKYKTMGAWAFYCLTHQQWTYDIPVKRYAEYDDGSIVEHQGRHDRG